MRVPTEDGFYWFRKDSSEAWIPVQALEHRGAWFITMWGDSREYEVSERFKKTKASGVVKGEFVDPLRPGRPHVLIASIQPPR